MTIFVKTTTSSEETIILKGRISYLGSDTSTYLKFQNSTGIYEVKNGVTVELESFVEPQWKIDYRDYLKDRERYQQQQKQRQAFNDMCDNIFGLLTIPFSFFLLSSTSSLQSALEITSETVSFATEILTPMAETPIVETSQSTGVGAEITPPTPRLATGESNTTHIWIQDPTNQTEGYYVEVGSGYQELNPSRGQTYRHWYNETSGEFTYKSDQMVNKTNTIDGTDWVTETEYPHRFVVRLTNGSIYPFETVSEINAFYSLIENDTIWAVGYESFEGVMGFYLNFADLDWGHGQYLYWPRLKNGQITAYNQPLYALYPHLYAKFNDVWYDKILNDRSLYTEPYQNPRNTLHFYNNSDEFGLYFSTPNIAILSSTWNFMHGFKYNFTDNLYHMITRFECTDRDFQDIGMGYEITSSPQSDGTPYQPDRFVLSNATHEVTVNIQEAWNAGEYLKDYYSQIAIISQNNESFHFTFEDIESAGFTQKYLNLHDQQLPDGSIRKTLRVGMYGYGAYSQGEWITIDPTVGPVYSTDNYDITNDNGSWNGGYTVFRAGIDTDDYNYGFVAFNTGLGSVLYSTGSVVLQLYTFLSGCTMDSSAEGIDGRVYAVKSDNDNNDQAREDSMSYALTAYYTSATDVLKGVIGSSSYHTLDGTQMEILVDYWAANKDGDDTYISFYFYANDDCDAGTDDRYAFYDSQYADTTRDPKIQFNYVYNIAPVASYVTGMQNTYAGKSFATIKTDHTDQNGGDGSDVDWCHVLLGVSGTWYGATWNVDTDTAGETGDHQDWGSIQGVSESVITDGFRLTWTLTLDWDFAYDDADYDIYVRTYDEQGVLGYSGWQEAGTTTHENELVVQTLDFALSDAGYSDDGDTDLNLNEWFRGGASIRGIGTVRYEGASGVSPPNSVVNAQLWTDGTDRGDSYDVAVTSGAFTTPYYTTETTAGYDDTYALDVTLQNFPTGGSEGSGGVAGFNTKRDNDLPDFVSFTQDADADSGADGYAPNTGYEDDATLQGDVVATDTGSSGLKYYYIQSNENGVWSSADVDGLDIQCTLNAGENNIHYKLVDNVGNERTETDTGTNIFYGTTDPTSMDFDVTVITGSDYLYMSDYTDITSGTLYINTGKTATWKIVMDASGNWQSGGAWKVVFEAGWGLGADYSDSSAPYESDDSGTAYSAGGAAEADLWLKIINNCGEVQTLTLTTTADTTAPSGYSLTLTADTASIGYTPNTNYYDDDSVDFAVGGSASDGGSGLPTNCYGFQYDAGSYSWQSETTKQYTSVSEANHTVDLKVIDNVGNEGTIYSEWVIVDTDSPSGHGLSFQRHTGIENGYYFYQSGSTLYFNSGEDDYWTVTVGVGTIQNSGFWKVEWDKNSVFITGLNDTSGLPDTRDFNYNGDSSGTFLIRIINNAGNYETKTYTATEDATDPTTTFTSITENDPHTYIWYDGSTTVYFSDLMGSTDQLFTVVVTADDGGAGLYGVRMSAWDDDADTYDTSSPYSRQYSTDDTETSGSINLYAYDHVGNYDGSPVVITMTEDAVAPSLSITWNFDANDYAIKSDSDFGWTDIDVDSTQDTSSGLNAIYIQAYDHSSGSPWQAWRTIASGLDGDTGSKTYLNQYLYYTDDGETTGTYLDDEYDNDQDFYRIVCYDMVGNYNSQSRYTRLDRTAPDSYSLVMESGWFYASITNDSTPLITCSGATDNGGSGLHATAYQFSWRVDGGEYTASGYLASNTWNPTVTQSQDVDFRVYVRDVVGNAGGIEYDNDNTVDLSNPSFTNIGGSESSDYLHAVGATTDNGYYGSGMGSAQTFNVIGDITDNFGLEKANGTTAFGETPQDTSITGTSDAFLVVYTIESSDNGDITITIKLYDQGGNVVSDTFTFYEDNTAPTGTITDIAESSDYLYDAGGTTTLWYGDDMPTARSFTITLSTHNDAGAGIWKMTGEAFFGESLKTDTTADYTFVYSPDSSDTETGTLSIIAYDHVNNNQEVDTITVYRDITNPSSSLSELTEDSEYLYWNTTHLFISDTMGTETQYFTVTLTSSDGGTNPSDIYAVEFLETAWGDNTPQNDTTSPYSRQFEVTSNEDSVTMVIKAVDNVGNWETTIEITIIDEGSGPNVALGVGVDIIGELSNYLYSPDNTTFYYGDDMGNAQSVTFNLVYEYNGSAGISHINTTIAWWGDSPSTSIDTILGIIYNPSFESSLTQWTGTASRVYSPSFAHTGNYAIQANPNQYLEQDITNTLVYNINYLSFWSTALSTHDIQVIIFYTDATNTTINMNGKAPDASTNAEIRVNNSNLELTKTIDKIRIRNSDSSYTYHWDDVYIKATKLIFDIKSSDTQTGTMYVAIWTNTGQTTNDTVTVYRDTATTLTWTSGQTSESSIYLYYDGSSQYGYYGDQMGSTQQFTIGGTYTESGGSHSGIGSLVDNVTFGDNPTADYSGGNWDFDYQIDSADSSSGTFTVTYNLTDNVGNINTDTFQFISDTTEPTITYIWSEEGSPYLFWDNTTWGNIVNNPDAEEGNVNWTFSNVITSTDQAHLGSRSFRFGGANAYFEQDFANGTMDSITFYAFTYPGGVGANITVKITFTDATTHEVNISLSIGSQWRSFHIGCLRDLSSAYYNKQLHSVRFTWHSATYCFVDDIWINHRAQTNRPEIYDRWNGNSGFEYGNLTEWSISGSTITSTTVIKHGLYSAYIPSDSMLIKNLSPTLSTANGIYAIKVWYKGYLRFQYRHGFTTSSIDLPQSWDWNVGFIYASEFIDPYEDPIDLIQFLPLSGNLYIDSIEFITNDDLSFVNINDTTYNRKYGFYSDNMGSTLTSFSINGTATDGLGIVLITDNTTFGNNPTVSQSGIDWSFAYQIDTGDTSYGTITIFFEITDLVGNTANFTFRMIIDNTNPVIFLDTSVISETSPYLYYDGSSAYGYYSDNMGSTLTDFNITGITYDLASQVNYLREVVDNTALGNNPTNIGGWILQISSRVYSSWLFNYHIDEDDDSFGTITVEYRVYDHVNNSNTVSFQFKLDNTNPAITWLASQTNESSIYLYYDGSSQWGYYSDDNLGISSNIGLWCQYNATPLIDSSDYGRTITVTTWGDGGLQSGSYNADAYKYAEIAGEPNIYTAHNSMYHSSTFTIGFWVYIDVLGFSSPDIFYFTYKQDAFWMGFDHNRYMKFNFDGTTVTSSVGLALSTWYFVAGSYNGTHGSLYINGALNNTNSGSYSPSGTSNLYLVYDSGTADFEGRLDDSFFINNSLTSNEIYALYQEMPDVGILSGHYFYVGGSGTDGGSGVYQVLDNTTYGANPLNNGTASLWSFPYILGGVTYNDFNITFTLTDNCNNSVTDWFYFYLDTTDPTIQLDVGEITENSPYLYYSGSGSNGFYSDNMGGSLVSFIINGSCSDSGTSAGLLSVIQTPEDPAGFGNNPSNTGTITQWMFLYQIDQNDNKYDTENNRTMITFTITDNVGHTNTVVFYFCEDLSAPTGTYTLTADPDALVSNWDNDTTANTVISGATDGSSPPASGLNTTHTYTYQLDSGGYGDWNTTTNKVWTTTEGTRVLYIAIKDRVNNTVVYSITIYVDLTDPTIDDFDWKDPTYAPNFYRAIDNEANFNVTWTETNPYLVNASNTELSYSENDNSPSGSLSDFIVTITGINDGYYNITVTIFDNAGNRGSYTATGSSTIFIDNTGPTITFVLVQDSQALVSNYYHVLLVDTQTSGYNDGVNGSGIPSLPYAYRKEGFGWGSWESNTAEQFIGNDQTNVSLYAKARDNVGWESSVMEIWVICDTVFPVLGWLTMDEMYAPNWYDQAVTSTANIHIHWVETYPYNITMGVSPFLIHTNDTSPSGTSSDLTVTINGASDGSYALTVTIWDNAGNSDTTLAGSEAPINLESGMSSLNIENWFYFYFFRSDAVGLDWRDFNVSYVLDENYRNYTEQRIRGALYSQKYLNLTSSIRFIVRGYFGDIITNTSYSLPTSLDLYITLPVYTLKVSNLDDEIMNMTVERPGSAVLYTEQLMPFEIFGWNVYAAVYNITTYIHDTTTIALDELGNSLNDYQINLTLSDFALFVDAPLRFTSDSMDFSEIWTLTLTTNKDHKTIPPVINIYLNGSSQGSGDFSPGIIILSRPQASYYNLTLYVTWQNYNVTDQKWVTVESNAELINFVPSGLESTSDEVYISWNTNKGNGILRIYDNGSLIQTNALEGTTLLTKSDSIGLHELEFNVSVETLVFTHYANYTIEDWSVSVAITLYDEARPTVSIYKGTTATRYRPTVTVTRSDGEDFSGYVYINGTDITVTVVNNEGTFSGTISSDVVGQIEWVVTSVQDMAATSRSFVASRFVVTFDELIGTLYHNGGTSFTVYFNSSYTDENIDNFRYKVTVGGITKMQKTTETFDIAGVMAELDYGTYEIDVISPENLDNYVKVGTNIPSISYTKKPPPRDEAAELVHTVQNNWIPFGAGLLIVILGGVVGYRVINMYRKQQVSSRSSGVPAYDKARTFYKRNFGKNNKK